ncbi:uncharacterized protein LTR77_007957 [Saxophila tyrrhenica]|uniref:Malic acid transport protein n=1 Tax=Saxophila tyrrhenica TaxID=1690608 RepID=A0AAV9P7C7_9PEZI|nr:hypothetical protein LTR77_007957 [Saxophila tyrrhenica]
MAAVISQTPNTFHGLATIGKIFYILDVVMFVTFTIAMAMRFVLFPRKVLQSLYHPVEGLFFGAYFVSVGLILNGAQAYGVPNCGPWLVTALRVCFWMYCGTVLLVAIFQYYVLFQNARLDVANAVPAWIFPIYPLLVVGSLASVMLPSQPRQQAYNMWIGAVMLQGLAWTVALLQYAIYMQRLMTSQLPPPPTRPGMYVSVGPAGYTAAALIGLANAAPTVLPANAFNVNPNFGDGQVVKDLGIISGTFILLFSFWFFCISTAAVCAGIKKMTYTLNWWAFVFPNAGLALAAIQLGSVYSSPGINGICSALTVMLVILWFIAAIFCVRAVIRKEITYPGKDEDAS